MSLPVPTFSVTAGTVAPPVSAIVPSVAASLLNSTLLSAILLSFGGQRYTPVTASSFDDEYDYIVVGAGSAGSVVASRLSEVPCVSVLLLEAGKQPSPLTEIPGLAYHLKNTNVDWAYKTSPQKYGGYALKNQQIIWPSGKALGGSSVMNAMFYTRGNRQNYDNWAAAGAKGWSYNDVLPYFIKAEDNRNDLYVASGYHGKGGPLTVHRPWYRSEVKGPVMRAAKYLGYDFVDSNGASQTGFYDFQSTMRGGQRCSTGKAYLVPAENRTNLSIVPNARVRKVIIKNKRAVGVEVDYMGQTRIVRARKEVILSAGTVNTAQLLMLSGIGPKKELKKHNISIVEDLPVGENLQDQVLSIMFFEIDNPTVQSSAVKLTSPASVTQYVGKRSGPLASAQLIFLDAFLKNNETHPAEDFPNHQLYQGEGTVNYLLSFDIKTDVYAKTFAPYSGKPMIMCSSQIMQPKSRGRVTLQSSDPYAAPIINPNYYKDPQDVKAVAEGLNNCIRLCTSPPTKSFGIRPLKTLMSGCEQYANDMDKYLGCYARSLVFTTNHQVGTAKMGDTNDPTTVVDPLLRVKNIDRLRVVDCSVMPIVPSGNTNAPAIMVGEKASDMIKSTINCDCEQLE